MTDPAAATEDRSTQARDLAEQALDHLAQRDDNGADALLDQSRALDPPAAAGLVADLDEDAAGPGDEDEEEELDEDEDEDDALDEEDDEGDDDLDDAEIEEADEDEEA